nr:MAG TPA: hypothetical protein [Caudoviricetes sp.]
MKIITSIHNEKLFILILFFNTSGNHKKIFTTRHTFNIFLIFLYERKHCKRCFLFLSRKGAIRWQSMMTG